MEDARHRRRFLGGMCHLLAGGAIAGCAQVPGWRAAASARPPGASPAEIAATRAGIAVPDALLALVEGSPRLDFLLLGEVHDHPLHHQLRAEWLARLARSGRFAIAFEQFDQERQADLDAGRASGLVGEDLARAAGFDFRGWKWERYAPLVEVALRERLAIVAANLSRRQAREIARGGPAPEAVLVPPGWGESERSAMIAAITEGHCGLLPERAVARTVDAQLARDATIAAALVRARENTGQPVVLIAGNGHVRRDIGVARHLAARLPGARTMCVGFLERTEPGDDGPSQPPPFDLVVRTPAHPRPDPCEGLRRVMPPPLTA